MSDQNSTTPKAYNSHDHLVKIQTKQGLKDYLPAAWRLYELNLRYPNANFRSEILHLDVEHNFAIVKCTLYLGSGDLAMAERKTEAMKQGMLNALDKLETAAKARCARDLGISTELALDREDAADEHVVDADAPTSEKAETDVSASKAVQPPPSSTEPKQELPAIKADIKGLGLAHTPAQWADWKRKVLEEDISDGQLKPHHLAKLHGAVETLKRQEATTKSKHLDPAIRDRMNLLYTRAKFIVPSCESSDDFKVYLARVLKLNRVDVSTLRTLDLDYVEADIIKREAAAMEAVA